MSRGFVERFLAPLALVALVVFAYAQTLDAGFVVWDDDDHIYENRHIVAEDGFADAFRDWRDPAFYPLTFSLWWTEWRLANGEPWLFHLGNVVLHAANAVLLGLLFRALGLGAGLSWAAAGLWALNPVQVATVAWATERKNVLYVFFYLAALLAYARSLVPPDGAKSTGRAAFLLSLALFTASLASKATAVTLPVAAAALHWTVARPFDRRAIARLSALFALALVAGGLHVSREQVTPLLPFDTRAMVAARAIWFYVGKFLWPADLVPVYPRWPLDRVVGFGLVSLAGIGAVLLAAFVEARRLPRAAWFGGLLYVSNVALVVGIVWFPFMIYSFASDHLVYLPSAGLALLAVLAADAVLRWIGVPARAALATIALLWVVLAGATRAQTAYWHDTESLWGRTLQYDPANALAHKNLGAELLEKGDLDEAQVHFEEVLRSNPGDHEALLNLGVVAAERGQWEEARRHYEETLARGFYESLALRNLGIVAANTGALDEAVSYYERALAIDPDDAATRTNLGAARVALGDLEGGIADHRAALRADPRFLAARFNLASALEQAGRHDEATVHYEEASRLAPDDPDPLYRLGVLALRQSRPAQARAYLERVLVLAPERADVAYDLGAALLAEKQLEPAIAALQRAATLAPGDVRTAGVLAGLLEESGRTGEAVVLLERVDAAGTATPRLLSRLAWIRATSTDPRWRDPEAAVRLAERAAGNASAPHPVFFDTLAGAYAGAGRFEEAVPMAQRALEQTEPGSPAARERERRLALYESGKAYTP